LLGLKDAETEYLNWLVNRLNVVPHKNYGVLLRELHRWEFWSNVPYDEDRGADGIAIRHTWVDEVGYKGDISFGPPRILETIVGIALRIEDRIFGGPWADDWDYKRIFWDLINNLGLTEYDGILTSSEYDQVATLLGNFLGKVSRDSFPNIFVFSVTPKNLRKMNLWSQMGLYIKEKWPGNTYL
jgi:hypothetical protein